MNFKYIALSPDECRSWREQCYHSEHCFAFTSSMYSDLWKQGWDGGDKGFYRDYGGWQVYEAIGFELRYCGSVESILKAKNEPN